MYMSLGMQLMFLDLGWQGGECFLLFVVNGLRVHFRFIFYDCLKKLNTMNLSNNLSFNSIILPTF
jgi:hypothetical protein